MMYWIIQREVDGQWFTKAEAETETLANAIASIFESRFGWNVRYYHWQDTALARAGKAQGMLERNP